MSVLKDWFHGITPAKRKEINPEHKKEQETFLHAYEEKKKEQERQARERIFSSPVANKIATDLVGLFSQDIWYYGKDCFGRPKPFPAKEVIPHATIYVDETAVEVYSSGKDNVHTCFYSFPYEQNGYKKLSVALDRIYLNELITTKIRTVLPDNCYFEYLASMGNSTYWKSSRPDSPRCDRICIRQKDPDPTPKQPLKSW